MEHGQIGIGFHRITNQMRAISQRCLVGEEGRLDGLTRIHIGRCTMRFGDGFKRDALAVERALPVLKYRHQSAVADASSGSAGRSGPC